MKLTKLLCTLAAVTFTGFAVAETNTSLKKIINDYFQAQQSLYSMQQQMGAMSDSELEEFNEQQKTLKAVWVGLLNYEEHLAANNLDAREEKIREGLTKIPQIINKIKQSSQEVEEEILSAFPEFAYAVVTNQRQIDIHEIDEEMATGMIYDFCIYKGNATKEISNEVMQILGQEALQELFNDMTPEEKEEAQQQLKYLYELQNEETQQQFKHLYELQNED